MRSTLRVWALIAGISLLGMLGEGPSRSARASDLTGLLWPGGTAEHRADVQGRAVSSATLADRITVVSFVRAGCMILCVTRLMDLDRLARDLPDALRGRVVFLAIDTDPAADDAARLRAFAESLVGPEPRLHLLTADAAATRALAAALHYPASALPEPPPTVLLFDRRGQVAMTYGGDPLDAPRLARDIATLDTFTQGLDQASADASGPSQTAR
ncbi:SCO family protein [Methylobacterium sp. E-005]|uniref:SCO family protein n=1 Tax=Methylobacterium sp. E-005 TaxID=2836549 RepID=UPI001FB953B8|nr:SCO family protein [Methylobacterium sp. E-005]MCJ2085263.1 SCO family protein [Methylobacterium sp. E-005]